YAKTSRSTVYLQLLLAFYCAHTIGHNATQLMCSAAKDLGDLVKKDKVVVFMKGTPAQPMCGFSNAVVQILRMHGVNEYAAYNVLDDQDLRQGQSNVITLTSDSTIFPYFCIFEPRCSNSLIILIYSCMYGRALRPKQSHPVYRSLTCS
uniref:Glutaredoxin domain-containing protein n=1 Tax=Esox lucius TaxID=8010 RepID=A0AAY5KVU6_ESOLU